MNDLFKITESKTNPAQSSYTIEVNSSHPVFLGHFPGFPVIPGAILIEIGHQLIAKTIAKPIRFLSAREIKFLKPIIPSEKDTLQYLIVITEKDDLKTKLELKVRDVVCFKMSADYKIEGC